MHQARLCTALAMHFSARARYRGRAEEPRDAARCRATARSFRGPAAGAARKLRAGSFAGVGAGAGSPTSELAERVGSWNSPGDLLEGRIDHRNANDLDDYRTELSAHSPRGRGKAAGQFLARCRYGRECNEDGRIHGHRGHRAHWHYREALTARPRACSHRMRRPCDGPNGLFHHSVFTKQILLAHVRACCGCLRALGSTDG